MPRRLAAAVLAALLAAAPALAAGPPGYVGHAPLAYRPPPPPQDPELLKMDVARVRAAQALPSSPVWQEANGDARAYLGQEVVRRFEDAAGTDLSPERRPILVHVLQRVIQDTGDAADVVKKAPGYARERPYVAHADIAPCYTNYLAGTEAQSYPSGHAMNGYVVGSLLADLIPGRAQQLLARGVRYGDNRVVCGVHHPTDVEQGRLLAVAYLAKLRASPEFQAEFACAGEEHRRLAAATAAPLSAACAALAARLTPKADVTAAKLY